MLRMLFQLMADDEGIYFGLWQAQRAWTTDAKDADVEESQDSEGKASAPVP